MRKRILLFRILACLMLVVSTVASFAQTANKPTSGQWAMELRDFAREDSLNKPPKAPILFYGSSSVRMWQTLATDFPGRPVVNRGFGGSRFPDAIQLFDKLVVAYKPRQVVLYEGDNDIGAGATPQEVYQSFQVFAELMRRKLPRTQLVFLAIKPSIARWALYPKMQEANKLIQKYIQAHPKQLRFVDVATPLLGPDGKPHPELYREDGLHMTRTGYEIWTRVLTPTLLK
ncbi:SGNH/GDSL hydrolase family protein [Hymenobacter norwichensis]|uniref:SGNH/GDSL hydrolase family protein n=1 Tax=Hymenobacter norwichensis TaxID=223903 RepID=UPI000523F4A7|nr:SGNH/GDSL hydrolase family protein [Hymenobacter norwichensis]